MEIDQIPPFPSCRGWGVFAEGIAVSYNTRGISNFSPDIQSSCQSLDNPFSSFAPDAKGHFTAFFRLLPAVNFGTFLAGILISLPV